MRGTGPRATVLRHIPSLTVVRGPVPRIRRSVRGTGPRATVCWRFFDAVRAQAIPNYRCLRCRQGPLSVGQDRQILTRSGSGDPELQNAGPLFPFGLRRSRTTDAWPPIVGQDRQILTRSGLLRWAGIVPGSRSARACPSPSSSNAGDRPPRYGGVAFFCSVRDLAIPNYRLGAFPPCKSRSPDLDLVHQVCCARGCPLHNPFGIRRSRTTGARAPFP